MVNKLVKKLFQVTIPVFVVMLLLTFVPCNEVFASELSSGDETIEELADEDANPYSDEYTNENTTDTQSETAETTMASARSTEPVSTADFDSMGIFFFLIGIGVGAIAIVSIREYFIEK